MLQQTHLFNHSTEDYLYYALDKPHTHYNTINPKTKYTARLSYRSTDLNDEKDWMNIKNKFFLN